jgi:tetratricopeptide (TPR) repeat protein
MPHIIIRIMPIDFIILLMVKNESSIIERCMRATATVASAFCICDTGSTDDTCAVATATAAALQKPIKIYNHEWKNFGHNRTLSFQACQEYCSELGKNPAITYAFLLDGDMVLMTSPKTEQILQGLSDKGYYIMQKAGNLEYKNVRLLRLDWEWKCIGSTHEYWDGPAVTTALDGISIDDRNDGGCKADKYVRDERLLLEDLEKDPSNVRSHFYLAQTYRCMGKFTEAIKWYKKRAELGGWYEERWYSMYQICQSYIELDKVEKAEVWAARAYALNPYRAEAFYALCKHFRAKSCHWKAMHYYVQGKQISKPSVALFLEPDVYDYLFDYEYTILQFYISNNRKEGLIASTAIVNGPAASNYKYSAYNNMEFYIEQPVGTKLKDLNFPVVGDFVPSSTSILWDASANRFLYNVRYVNYSIGPQGAYTIRDAEGKCRTKNAMILGGNMSFVPDEIALPQVKTDIFGLEDVRLFRLGSDDATNANINATSTTTYFCATSLQYSPKPRIIIGEYPSMANCHILEPPMPTDCEKNWLPIIGTSVPTFIYKWHPLTIGKIDLPNTTLQVIHSDANVPAIFEYFRGSTPVYTDETSGDYWCIIHSVKHGYPRRYFHAIVYLDSKSYRVKKYTTLFVFEKVQIEYCLGAYMQDNTLYAVFSRNDSRPAVAEIPLNSLTWIEVVLDEGCSTCSTITNT